MTLQDLEAERQRLHKLWTKHGNTESGVCYQRALVAVLVQIQRSRPLSVYELMTVGLTLTEARMVADATGGLRTDLPRELRVCVAGL
jgi:hypothetical protein